MAEEKEVKTNPLQPDICEKPEKPEPDRICPDCVPNQSYSPPTKWWEQSDPYLNELACEYWIAVSVNSFADSYGLGNYASSGFSLETLVKTYVRNGVRKIVRFFDKLEADEIICATPPARLGGTCSGIHNTDYEKHMTKQTTWANSQMGYTYKMDSPETIAAMNPTITNSKAIELYGRALDYHFTGFGASSTLIVLVSIPAFVIDRLPSAPEASEVLTHVEEVIVDAKKFLRQLAQLAAIFNLFSKYQAYFYQYENGGLLQEILGSPDDAPSATKTFYLKYMPGKIDQFEKHLASLIDMNGYNWGTFAIFDSVKKIKFVFDKSKPKLPFSLKSVEVQAGDCDWVKMKKGFGGFKKKPVMGQTLLGYIAYINDIEQELGARVSPPWLDFVLKYTYPPLKVNYGMSNLTSEFELGCVGESLQKIDDFILKEVVSFSKAFQYNLNKENCKTLARRGVSDPMNPVSDTDFKDGKDLSNAAEKFIKEIKTSYREPFSPFTDFIKKIKENQKNGITPAGQVGKGFKTVFSMVNPCKWKEIVMDSMKCAMAGLDIKTVYLIFIKKTLANLAGEGLEIVFGGLPLDKQDKIMKIITEEFKDMPMPWEVGYVVGGAYSENMNRQLGERAAKKANEWDLENNSYGNQASNQQRIEDRFNQLGFNIKEEIIQPFLSEETVTYSWRSDDFGTTEEPVFDPFADEADQAQLAMEELDYERNLGKAASEINFADSKYDQFFAENDAWRDAYTQYRQGVDSAMAMAMRTVKRNREIFKEIKSIEERLLVLVKEIEVQQNALKEAREDTDNDYSGTLAEYANVKYNQYLGQTVTDAKGNKYRVDRVSNKNRISKAKVWWKNPKRTRTYRWPKQQLKNLEIIIKQQATPAPESQQETASEVGKMGIVELQRHLEALRLEQQENSSVMDQFEDSIGDATAADPQGEANSDQTIPAGVTVPWYDGGFEKVFFRYDRWKTSELPKEIAELRAQYTNSMRMLYDLDKNRRDSPEYAAWSAMTDEEKAEVIETEKQKANAITLGMDPDTVIIAGTLNTALGNVQKAVVPVLIEAIMETSTMSEIMSTFDKLPGSGLIAKYLATWKCPNTHWVNPPIDSFLSTLTFDPCGPEGIKLHLPPIPKLKSLTGWSVWRTLFDVFFRTIKSQFFNAIIALILKLASLVDKAMCSLAGVPAKIAMAAAEGGLSSLGDADTWTKMVDELVCGEGDKSSEERNNTVASIMNKAGVSPVAVGKEESTGDSSEQNPESYAEEVNLNLSRGSGAFNPAAEKDPLSGGSSNQVAPNQGPQSTEKLVELGRLLSTMATKNELSSAIASLPEEQDMAFMGNIATLINLRMPEFSHVLGNSDLVSQFFSTIGNFLTPEQRQQLRNEAENPMSNFPVNDSICLTDEQKDEWDLMRTEALVNAGAKPKDAIKIINRINDRDKSDFADSLDLLVTTPEGVLQDTIDSLFSPEDPDCKLRPVFSIEPDELKADIKQVNDSLYKNLAKAYTDDLLDWNFFEFWDASGILSTILSNKKGHLLNKHNLINGSAFWRFSFTGGFDRVEAPRTVGLRIREELLSNDITKTNGLLGDALEIGEGIFGEDFIESTNESIQDALATIDEELDGIATAAQSVTGVITKDKDAIIVMDFRNGEGFTSTIKILKRKNVKKFSRLFDYRAKLQSPVFNAKFTVEKELSLQDEEYLYSFVDEPEGDSEQLSNHKLSKSVIDMGFLNNSWRAIQGARFSEEDAAIISDGISSFLNNNFMKKLLDGRGGDLPEGFLYGDESEPLTVDDLTYVDPEPGSDSYTYEEEDRVLGRSKTNSPRVYFLDPAKHGGTYENPHRYIEAEAECGDQRGWMMLSRFIAPNVICGTKENDFLYLNQLKNQVDDRASKIPSHDKLDQGPECTFEKPFDKIASSRTLANLEGAVMATIRIYITEFIIKSMPILSNINFDLDVNYDELVSEYILKNIEKGCIDQVSWWTASSWEGRNYWLLFLEQAAQTALRMTISGEIGDVDEEGNFIGPSELSTAKMNILDVQHKYNYQQAIEELSDDWAPIDNSMGKAAGFALMTGILIASGPVGLGVLASAAAAGTAGGVLVKFTASSIRTSEAKFALKMAAIDEVENSCKTMLKYLIRQQLKFYRAEMSLKLKPRPYIYDVTKYLLGGSNFSLGKKPLAGIMDVENPVGGGQSNQSYGDMNDCVANILTSNPLENFNLSPEDIEQLKATGGFFLEKYIRIVTPDVASKVSNVDGARALILNRDSALKGVVSIKDFKDFLNQLKAISGAGNESTMATNQVPSTPKYTKLSEFFGDSAYMDLKDTIGDLEEVFNEKDQKKEQLSITGIKFGVRVCYVPPEGVKPIDSSAFNTESNAFKTAQREKSYLFKPLHGQEYPSARFIFPVCSFEEELPDASIDDYLDTDGSLNQDLKCYVDNMAETKEYKMFFHKIHDVRRVPSLMSVYSAMNFIPALGQGTDEREFGDDDPVSNEEIKEGFNDSKYAARRLFVSLYKRNDFDPPDEEEEYDFLQDETKRLWANTVGRINFGDDVPWWLRKRIDNPPFDCEENLCGNSFSKLFQVKKKEE